MISLAVAGSQISVMAADFDDAQVFSEDVNDDCVQKLSENGNDGDVSEEAVSESLLDDGTEENENMDDSDTDDDIQEITENPQDTSTEIQPDKTDG